MSLKKRVFSCLDIESTGLDPKEDKIVEIAVVSFTFDTILEQFESLVDPQCVIPQESIDIHHITNEMVFGKPQIAEVLPEVIRIIGENPIVGHNIQFDIDILMYHAQRYKVPCDIGKNISIDTLRLARFYEKSPSNSLEQLRKHFGIVEEGAHRAMSDVLVNIQVFQKLCYGFETLADIRRCLSKPIKLKTMPLGKHKGRPLKELPQDYLLWAARQKFDQDLLFSLRSEVNRRKSGSQFIQAANPFMEL